MLIHESKTYCSACFTELEEGTDICPSCGYRDDNSSDRYLNALPIGTVLMGKYVIGQVLGKGGFGITYLAFNLKENKAVAIKEYLPDSLIHRNTGDTMVSTYQGDKEEHFRLGAEKFFEEAKTVSKFNGHPNIINVYEFFYENNTAYFVMEYIKGVDLKSYIRQHGGKLSEEVTLKLMTPVLDALIIVHSIGVLHRDISPDNIFIGDDGNVKLLDFGSARQVLGQQSKSLSVIIKTGFAPVEQYQTKGKQGPWTDIYSLAATMYYCVTGSIPEDCMNRVSEDTLLPPSAMGINISAAFENLILKGMAFQAADRYSSVYHMKGDMEKILLQLFREQTSAEHKSTKQSLTAQSPPEVTTANKVSAENKTVSTRKLKAIIGVMSACIVIIIGIAIAVIIHINDSVSTGETGGSDIVSTIGSVTVAPEANTEPDTTNAPTITPNLKATESPVVVTNAATANDKPSATVTEEPTPTPKPTESPYDMYIKGMDSGNYEDAVYWFTKSAKKGNGDAQYQLGLHYEYGLGVEQSYKKAAYWYKKSAAQGDAYVQYCLGSFYKDGKGVEQSYEKAAYWYKKSANQGNDDAQYYLGYLYSNGLGVEQDYKKALSWYKKSAEQGDSDSQNEMGDLYYYSRGVDTDYEKALYWWKLAAKQGSDYAEYNIGFLYEHGQGVEQDYKKALSWYKKSADQGDDSAQNELGSFYYYGTGVEIDYEKARYWWKLAAKQGNEDAKSNLKLLE